MFSRYEKITRPAQPPMDLDQGVPTPRLALSTTGVTLAFLAAAMLCAVLAYLLVPRDGYSEFPVWAMIAAATLAAAALFCFTQAYTYAMITRRGWVSYYARLDDWHNASLDAYEQAQGKVEYTATSVYELSADHPHHLLLAALAIHNAIERDPNSQRTPYSVRALGDGLQLHADGHAIKLGELTGTQPERMATALAQLGLIAGRSERTAGRWQAQSYADVIDTVARNYHKVGNKRRYEVD